GSLRHGALRLGRARRLSGAERRPLRAGRLRRAAGGGLDPAGLGNPGLDRALWRRPLRLDGAKLGGWARGASDAVARRRCGRWAQRRCRAASGGRGGACAAKHGALDGVLARTLSPSDGIARRESLARGRLGPLRAQTGGARDRRALVRSGGGARVGTAKRGGRHAQRRAFERRLGARVGLMREVAVAPVVAAAPVAVAVAEVVVVAALFVVAREAAGVPVAD